MNPAASSSSAGGTQAMDLNYRLVCKDCQQHPPNIVEDYKNGDLICGDCGLVFPMRIIDLKSEWRNFSSETGGSGDDPSRVGAFLNWEMEGGDAESEMLCVALLIPRPCLNPEPTHASLFIHTLSFAYRREQLKILYWTASWIN